MYELENVYILIKDLYSHSFKMINYSKNYSLRKIGVHIVLTISKRIIQKTQNISLEKSHLFCLNNTFQCFKIL